MATQSTFLDDPHQATMQAVRDHHDRLGRTMADHAVTIGRAVDRLSSPFARQAQLVAFCTEEVLPHAAAEEETLYRAASELPSARLLVQAMLREHALLRDLVGTLRSARTAGEVCGTAAALDTLFRAHLEKENELLLPALVDAGVDLISLLTGMHTILGGSAGPSSTTGGEEGGGTPGTRTADGELDVRPLAPAQRHERIFSAYEALRSGTAFVLVNDHDPKPLYYQFAAEHPGQFSWDPVESGPQVWRVRIGRP